MDDFLERSVTTFVVLDRDYQPQTAVDRLTARLTELGIQVHVWARKELESYFLHATGLARVAGTTAETVSSLLEASVHSMKAFVFARALEALGEDQIGPDRHRVSVTERFHAEFDDLWNDPEHRLALCPAKDMLHALNRSLQAAGHRTVSCRQVAQRLRAEEVPAEMRDLLLRVEATL